MTVTFRKNFDIGKQLTERTGRLKKAIAKTCQDEIARIQLSTEAGRDIEGKQFKGYSKPYAAWRKKRGYRVSPPNLTVKGRMLGSMDYEVTRQGWEILGRIFFRGARQGGKAQANIDLGRKFFGLSKRRAQQIINSIQEQF